MLWAWKTDTSSPVTSFLFLMGGGGKAGVEGPGLLFRTCEGRGGEEKMGQDLCLGVQMADSVLEPWGDYREGRQKL